MHRLIGGRSGSGKTFYAVLIEAMNIIRRWDRCVTLCLPHADVGMLLLAQLLDEFGESILPRLIVRPLGDLSSVITGRLLHSSTATDAWQRAQDNDAYLDAWLEIFARKRKIKNWDDSPNLDKYLRIAGAVGQNQDIFTPEYMLEGALIPGSPTWTHYRTHCTDQKCIADLDSLHTIPQQQRMTSNEAAARAIRSIYRDTTIMAMVSRPPTFDRVKFKNECGIELILGNSRELPGKVSRSALQNAIEVAFQEEVFLRRAGLVTTPGTFYKDEAINYGTAGAFDAEVVNTMRYLDLDLVHLVQTLGYETPEITRDMLQSTDHKWFPMGDPMSVKLVAEDLIATFDRMKVHHTTSKKVFSHHQYEERKTHSHQKDHGGQTRGETETVTHVPVAQYMNQVDQHFESGSDQLFWMQQDIRRMPERHYWNVPSDPKEGPPSLEEVPLWEDPWLFDGDPENGIPPLRVTKAHECIQRAKEYHRELYQAPMMVDAALFATAAPARATTKMERNATQNSSASSATRPALASSSGGGSSRTRRGRGGDS